MEFIFPKDDLDRSQALLRLLGSFWNRIWGGDEAGGAQLITTYIDGLQKLEQQTRTDLQEAQDAVSRLDLPVFHQEHWHLLTLVESELNDEQTSLPLYGAGHEYEPAGIQYGVPVSQTLYHWPAPSNLVEAPLILNRITSASLVLHDGVDYELNGSRNLISFRENPFDNPLVPKRDIFSGTVATDREAALWVFSGKFDYEYVYRQFAYILQLRLASSDFFKDFVNAILDSLVRGTSSREVDLAFSAITGTPITLETEETIETVVNDGDNLVIVSDLTVYRFPKNATSLVAVGDTVKAGEPLVDTFQVFEFNKGKVPDELAAITTGRGFITEGFMSDITWENQDVQIEASTDENGRTRIEWEIGGFPGDTEEFWDRVHKAGTAAGTTSLAQLLDPRISKTGEPPASAFNNVTINPLRFLIENVLRNNAFLVKIRASSLGEGALGLYQARLLRKIIPPETAMIVLTEVDIEEDPVILEGPGLDETKPSYEEDAEIFLGMEISENLAAPGMVTDRTVRLKQIAGRCL